MSNVDFDFLFRMAEILGFVGGAVIAISKIMARIKALEFEMEFRTKANEEEFEELKIQDQRLFERMDNNNNEIMRKLEKIDDTVTSIQIQNAKSGK